VREQVRPCLDYAQAATAAWRPYTGDAGWVASGGPRAPLALPTPVARASASPTPSHFSLLSPAALEHARARFRHRPHARLAGVGRSSHHRSLLAPPSRSEHRFHLMHPALASVCHGKALVHGNRSPEPGRAHRRALLRGPPLSAPPFLLFLSASCSPRLPSARVPLSATVSWLEMASRRAPAPPLCHYRWRGRTGAPSAWSAGAPESPRCGEHDGAHPTTEDLTVGEFSPLATSTSLGCVTCGASGPTVSHKVLFWVHYAGCTQRFRLDFGKRISEMIFQKIVICLFIS
jgi:hypothetical protein